MPATTTFINSVVTQHQYFDDYFQMLNYPQNQMLGYGRIKFSRFISIFIVCLTQPTNY